LTLKWYVLVYFVVFNLTFWLQQKVAELRIEYLGNRKKRLLPFLTSLLNTDQLNLNCLWVLVVCLR